MERLDRASQFLNVCADFGKAGVDFVKARVGLGLEFLEVRADRRRDIFAGGGGDIGDRVGDGQGVEIELRQGDGQAPRLMARVQRLVQALLILSCFVLAHLISLASPSDAIAQFPAADARRTAR